MKTVVSWYFETFQKNKIYVTQQHKTEICLQSNTTGTSSVLLRVKPEFADNLITKKQFNWILENKTILTYFYIVKTGTYSCLLKCLKEHLEQVNFK